MEQNEIRNVRQFPLYDRLKKKAEDRRKQNQGIINIVELKAALASYSGLLAKVVYWLILHHFLITENINPERLQGVKISFYKQRQNVGGKGVQFGEITDQNLIEILYEFVNDDGQQE